MRRDALTEQIAKLNDAVKSLEDQKRVLVSAVGDSTRRANEATEGYRTESSERDALQAKLNDVQQAFESSSAQATHPAETLKKVKAAIDSPTSGRGTSPATRLWGQAYKAYLANDIASAEKLYKQALDADPKHAPSLNSLGRIAGDRHDSSERGWYKRALDADPKYVPALNDLAILELESDNLDEAYRLAAAADSLRPGYTKALLEDIKAARAKPVRIK
jgi:Tfp pilus assembly protein PilF